MWPDDQARNMGKSVLFTKLIRKGTSAPIGVKLPALHEIMIDRPTNQPNDIPTERYTNQPTDGQGIGKFHF